MGSQNHEQIYQSYKHRRIRILQELRPTTWGDKIAEAREKGRKEMADLRSRSEGGLELRNR